MLVKDTVKKTELELTTAELIDLVANGNRQVDLVFDEKQSDEDGYLHWDRENWTSVDGKPLHSQLFPRWPRAERLQRLQQVRHEGLFPAGKARKSCLVKGNERRAGGRAAF